MRIHISSGPRRKKYNPQPGDRRVIRGVEHVRVHRLAYNGLRQVSNGRYLYDWIPADEYDPTAPHGRKELRKWQDKT